MQNTQAYQLTAYCGIYCGECECYKAKDNEKLFEYLVSRGVPKENLPCPGCREKEGNCPVIGETCETYACAISHGVDFCYECADFPCHRLNPAADRAEVLPHNLKLYCLCSIMNKGLEEFTKEYPIIKQKYYKGKMSVGKGPILD